MLRVFCRSFADFVVLIVVLLGLLRLLVGVLRFSTMVLFRFYALFFLSGLAIRDQGTITKLRGDVCGGVQWHPLNYHLTQGCNCSSLETRYSSRATGGVSSS